MHDRQIRGQAGEALAAAHVEGLGWRVLARNVRFRVGELDIVAWDGTSVVFVEVRSRVGRGGPRNEDSVTLPKQWRLTQAAQLWLQGAGQGWSRSPARFDVVSVRGVPPRVESHLRGAFEGAGL